MKKNQLFILLLFLSFGAVSHAQSWTSWGSWTTNSCYSGIDFRVKSKYSETTKKYEAYIEFRNRYDSPVSVSYAATGGTYTNSGNRVDIDAGSTYESWMGSSFTSDYFTINLSKLRKGNSEYMNCD